MFAVLIPSVTTFGDQAFEEVIKVKRGHRVGPNLTGLGVLIGTGRARSLHARTEEKTNGSFLL